MPRTPGKYGRRPPKNAPALDFAPLLTGAVVPGHPDAVDYLAAMGGGWKMLGNGPDDTVAPGFAGCGDCEAVRWANSRRMVTKVLGGAEAYPGWDQVLALYRTQNPGFDPHGNPDVNGPGSTADGGMDTQTLLEHLHTAGGPDGAPVVFFGKIDKADTDAVKAAIAIFGFVWADIAVLDVNQQEFADNQPWDYSASSPVDGLHAVLAAGYARPGTEPGALAGDIDFETWAEETSFTDPFWGHEVQGVWVAGFPEHLGTAAFQAGVDRAALEQAYTELTGKPFPAPEPVPPAPVPVPPPPQPPAPPPSPVPPAPPGPADADTALWATAGPWCARTRVRPDLARLKDALLAWAETKPGIH